MSEKDSCLRCGECCKYFHLQIPNDRNVDLSVEFLESYTQKYGTGATEKYVSEGLLTIEFICPWLSFSEGGVASCEVYDRRSFICSEYPYGKICHKGLSF